MMITRSQLPSSPVSTPHEYPCPQQRPGVGLGERRRVRSTQTDQKEERMEGELGSSRVGWTGRCSPRPPHTNTRSLPGHPPGGPTRKGPPLDPGVSSNAYKFTSNSRPYVLFFLFSPYTRWFSGQVVDVGVVVSISLESVRSQTRFDSNTSSLFRSCVCSRIRVGIHVVVGRRLVADLGMCACSVVGVSS